MAICSYSARHLSRVSHLFLGQGHNHNIMAWNSLRANVPDPLQTKSISHSGHERECLPAPRNAQRRFTFVLILRLTTACHRTGAKIVLFEVRQKSQNGTTFKMVESGNTASVRNRDLLFSSHKL